MICLCTSYEFMNYLLICALVFVPVTRLCTVTVVTVYLSSCALVTVDLLLCTCYCALVAVLLLLCSCYCALVTVQCTCYTCYFGVCTCLEGQQRRDARLGKVVRVVASYGFAASIAQYAGEAPACWQSQYPPGEHWTYGNCPTTDLFRSDPFLVWEHPALSERTSVTYILLALRTLTNFDKWTDTCVTESREIFMPQ